jgi:hypothetical protein
MLDGLGEFPCAPRAAHSQPEIGERSYESGISLESLPAWISMRRRLAARSAESGKRKAGQIRFLSLTDELSEAGVKL